VQQDFLCGSKHGNAPTTIAVAVATAADLADAFVATTMLLLLLLLPLVLLMLLPEIPASASIGCYCGFASRRHLR
jgi:hypothetical protein